jgi:hypothetical protein
MALNTFVVRNTEENYRVSVVSARCLEPQDTILSIEKFGGKSHMIPMPRQNKPGPVACMRSCRPCSAYKSDRPLATVARPPFISFTFSSRREYVSGPKIQGVLSNVCAVLARK